MIEGQTALAPLAGVGDRPFRSICKRFGAGLIYTEFISAQGLLHKNRATFDMLRLQDVEHPVGIQLFGSTSEVLAKVVKFVEDAGADFVDLNCGCPEPKVVRTGSGAALMSDPCKIAKIVEAMVLATKLPVTVKARIGVKKGERQGLEIARLAQEAGARAFAINCCYVSQGMAGPYDWDFIAELRRILYIPIVGNGGIRNGDDAKVVLGKGADAVMIGRACFGNPWVFAQINAELNGSAPAAPPSLDERFAVMREHLSLEVLDKGERLGVAEMRKHWVWYVKGLPGASKFREKAVRMVSNDGMLALLDDYQEKLYEELGG